LELLKWAHSQGCPWGKLTCAYFNESDSLELVEWARAHGCPE